MKAKVTAIRSSDGVAFSIGDKVQRNGHKQVDIIKGFNLDSRGNVVASFGPEIDKTYYENLGCNINIIEHYTELDYEILSFSKKDDIYTVRENGRLLMDRFENKGINADSTATHWTEAVEKGYQIYSVKRLSDGEVFTVGDRICNTNSFEKTSQGYVTIKKIDLTDLGLRIMHDTGYRNTNRGWNEISHYKKPLFTTDYEILTVTAKEEHPNIPVERVLKKWLNINMDHFNIHSVKRLSDGEVFTVGDKVTFSTKYPNFNIEKIIYDEKEKTIELRGNSLFCSLLQSNVQKVKKPIFTTEDGVDIFKGDIIFVVHESFRIEKFSALNSARYHKKFSTKEAAEEYVLMNKPCLSINDVLQCIPKLSNRLLTTLEELTKSKL
jgi:hypothetical protein